MSLYRFRLGLAAALVATLMLAASGCLPDPGPFYPRPEDSTPADGPVPGDGPPQPDTTVPLPDGPVPDGTPPTPDSMPPKPDMSAAPTFGQVYSQVIAPNCSCHQSGTPAAGLGMQDANNAFNNLVGQSARGAGPCSGRTLVVAGDSASSVLYNKLIGGGSLCGNTMPRNAAMLGQTLTDLVKNWIDSGAAQ